MNSADPTARTLAWDWYPGTIPDSVVIDDAAYVETTYSFVLCKTRVVRGVRIARGASIYLGTMFDVGPRARVTVGAYALVNGARIICDAEVEIGDFALISWNVVLMDTYRAPVEPVQRRQELERVPERVPRRFLSDEAALPIRIGRNVWIGFDCCILPGTTIGEGAIIGARSVVSGNVPPFAVVAGNPARVIRYLQVEEKDLEI